MCYRFIRCACPTSQKALQLIPILETTHGNSRKVITRVTIQVSTNRVRESSTHTRKITQTWSAQGISKMPTSVHIGVVSSDQGYLSPLTCHYRSWLLIELRAQSKGDELKLNEPPTLHTWRRMPPPASHPYWHVIIVFTSYLKLQSQGSPCPHTSILRCRRSTHQARGSSLSLYKVSRCQWASKGPRCLQQYMVGSLLDPSL
jgi:hypothetical protein